MATINVIQGDTTGVRKIKATGYTDISSGNWLGRVIVADTLGAVPLIDRAITKAADNTCFLGYLTDAETLARAVGQYSVTYEIQNLVVVPPIKKQFQHTLVVAAKANRAA